MNDKAERQAARVGRRDAQTKIQQTTEYPAKTGKVLRIAAAKRNRGAKYSLCGIYRVRRDRFRPRRRLGNRRQRRYFGLCGKIHPHQSEINSIPEFLSGARIPDALIPLRAVRAKGIRFRQGITNAFMWIFGYGRTYLRDCIGECDRAARSIGRRKFPSS